MTRSVDRALGERGASLVLVIVLVFMVGLIASATLSFAGTSIRASSAYGERADVRYDVDGALQAATNQIRNSTYVSSEPCPPLTVPGPKPDGDDTVNRDVLVTCEPDPGTGGASTTTPPALLATQLGARSGEVGLSHSGDAALRFVGDVHSQSNITTAPGPIEVDGRATAITGCTGDVRSDATNCNATPVAAQTVAQPTSGLRPRSVPECPRDGSTIRFEPGFYYDAAALTNLMNTCASSTFWFPGAAEGAKYYFDFHNGEVGSAAGEPVWNISNPDVRIVGGGTRAPGAPGTVTIPGSCTSPQSRNDNNGVQFVFGGRSRLRMTAGQLELCGPGDAAGKAPPVAIFGGDTQIGAGVNRQAGNVTAPNGNVPGILRMAAGTGTDDPAGCSNATKIACFGDKDRIVDWGGSDDGDYSSTGVFPGSQTQANRGGWRGIVDLRGYDPGDANPPTLVPAGATLVWANLYVRHREERRLWLDPLDPTHYIHVTVRPSRPGAPAVGPANQPDEFTPGLSAYDEDDSAFGVDTVDLLGAEPASSALQQEVTDHGLSGFDLRWLVAAKTGRRMTADLDSIQISLGWVTPNGFVDERTGKDTPPSAAEPDQPGILKSVSWPDPAPACNTANKVECFDNRTRIAQWGTDGSTSNFAETGVFPSTGQAALGGWRAIVNANGYAPSLATPQPSRPAWISPTTIVPPGAVLSYAKLYVRHRELRQSGGTSDPTDYIHAVVTPARAGAPQVGPANPAGDFTPGLSSHDTYSPPVSGDTVDLLATPALANEVRDHGLTGFNVQWIVAPKTGRRLNAGLDSLQIALGWSTPADFRPQDALIPGGNCVGAPTAAYPHQGSCALVQTSSEGGASKFHVQGTGYAQRAVFDLRQADVAAPVFTSGLIARAAAFGLTWAPGYTGPAVGGSKAQRLTVLFRAHTCPKPKEEGCPDLADWELQGTALVEYGDSVYPPRAGRRTVNVRSWTLDP